MWKPAKPSILHTLKKQTTDVITLAGDFLIASKNGVSSLVTETNNKFLNNAIKLNCYTTVYAICALSRVKVEQ